MLSHSQRMSSKMCIALHRLIKRDLFKAGGYLLPVIRKPLTQPIRIGRNVLMQEGHNRESRIAATARAFRQLLKGHEVAFGWVQRSVFNELTQLVDQKHHATEPAGNGGVCKVSNHGRDSRIQPNTVVCTRSKIQPLFEQANRLALFPRFDHTVQSPC
ncbi:hypothetical protein WL95_09130 [Burkholderia cepacia]|nr:hypothetical protein WL95_09130 [Burkholderia cepacia]